jgi:hypothetical protein
MAQKVKIDKEFLIKNRFWILLPAAILCVLIAWLCVLSVRGTAEANLKTANDKNRELKNFLTQDVRNQPWVDKGNQVKQESVNQKTKLWFENYDKQFGVIRDPVLPKTAGGPPGLFDTLRPLRAVTRSLYFWPPQTTQQWELARRGQVQLASLDFGEPLGNVPEEYKQEYPLQFNDILKLVDWLTDRGGSVRAAGQSNNHIDNARALLQILPGFGLTSAPKPVLSNEAWTLQEDLSIKRELLRALADVNNARGQLFDEWRAVAVFDGKRPAETPTNPDGTPAEPTPPPAPAEENPEKAKAPAAPVVLHKQRYYNTAWHIGQAVEAMSPAGADGQKEISVHAVEPWRGWYLDLELAVVENKLVLQGSSTNLSARLKVPATTLAVYFQYVDGGATKETLQPVLVMDAGDLSPSVYDATNHIQTKSTKALKPVPVPSGSIKISRVSRLLPDAQTLSHFRGYNSNWFMDVKLTKPANSALFMLKGKIYNRGTRRLMVPQFRFTLHDGRGEVDEPPARFPVAALNVGEAFEFTVPVNRPSAPPRSLEAVTEVLDWRTVPIKRLDRLEIGRVAHEHSDRTKIAQLRTYDFNVKNPNPSAEPPPPPPPDTGSAGGGGNLAGAGSGGGSIGPPAGGGFGNDASGGEVFSPNHRVPLKRYLEVSGEVRRLPVALVMVVESNAVNEVLTSLANSRLRYQVTLAPWKRHPSLGRPGSSGSPGSPEAGGGGAGAGLGGAGGGGAIGGGNILGGAGSGGGAGASLGPGGAGRPGAPDPAGSRGPVAIGVEDDSNVVHLEVYGIVSIFESPDALKRIEQQRANPGGTTTAAGGAKP